MADKYLHAKVSEFIGRAESDPRDNNILKIRCMDTDNTRNSIMLFIRGKLKADSNNTLYLLNENEEHIGEIRLAPDGTAFEFFNMNGARIGIIKRCPDYITKIVLIAIHDNDTIPIAFYDATLDKTKVPKVSMIYNDPNVNNKYGNHLIRLVYSQIYHNPQFN